MDADKKAFDLLEKFGIRPSYQRIQILAYLLEDDSHPTADCIYKNLQESTAILSKATVYNTLNLFVEKGLVSTMIADKFETRYDMNIDQHGHFICRACGKIYNFNYDYGLVDKELEGFKIEGEEIVVRGLCSDCNK